MEWIAPNARLVVGTAAKCVQFHGGGDPTASSQLKADESDK